jgi:hypothetical protein
MKQLYLILIFTCSLFNHPAFGEESLLKAQTQGDVVFVSGGIGSDEQNALQTVRADYNLSLLFSVRGTGEYLSDIKVSITDSRGNMILETISEGPMLLAQLKPGRYTVIADLEGQTAQRTAVVGNKRRTSISFIW